MSKWTKAGATASTVRAIEYIINDIFNDFKTVLQYLKLQWLKANLNGTLIAIRNIGAEYESWLAWQQKLAC